MAAVCYITQGQVLLVCGLHFTSLRMVLLESFTRIIMNGDLARLALNQVDKSVIIYVCYGFAVIPDLFFKFFGLHGMLLTTVS